MSIISLGLAENYAILGNTALYFSNALYNVVKGFMGSSNNSIIIDPDPTYYQLLPSAPIVNGAAAKQAIEDVNTAIPLYQAVTPAYTITGPVNLSAIIAAGPGLYNINGNLTTNANVTLNGLATDIYVFNVTGNINIKNNITLTVNLLPQNVIFIASGTIDLYYVNVSGIYIASNYVDCGYTKLIGRVISQTADVRLGTYDNTITAPQFA